MKKEKKIPVRMQEAAASGSLKISRPFLWLALAVFLLYLPSLRLGFTDLDDVIFIREMKDYMSSLANLSTSFTRGVFDAVKDTYYRPMFLNAMLLNYQVSGEDIAGYHFVNILLHLTTVWLFYRLLIRLDVRAFHAFLLALLFAVHPVLSQAVTWIPGRNDSLMAVFVLAFLLQALRYMERKRAFDLLLSFLWLLLGFFTKETALFAVPAAVVLLLFRKRYHWKDRRLLGQYAVWAAAILVYFMVRSSAAIKHAAIVPAELWQDFLWRLPLLIQYLGKIFFPFNLSVFPIMEDTAFYYGWAAIVLLIAMIWFAPVRNKRNILSGMLFFLIFLLPVLLVPRSMNEQTFEHRLYLPVMGILLVLPETVLFQSRKGTDRRLLIGMLALAGLFAVLNYRHQQHFRDPLSFWEQAYQTSPHSAYAVMMYGARVPDKQQQGYALMREAYRLNPDEKYLNYYYGVMLQEQDSLLESEKYFLKEKNASGYYECDFYLAKVAYFKKDSPAAIGYLEAYLQKNPAHIMANNNLLLLYIQTGRKVKARRQVQDMLRKGLSVPQVNQQQVESMPEEAAS